MTLGIFWGVAGMMALVVAAILIAGLRNTSVGVVANAEFDRRVYRDQLSEIDRDLSRGVIGEGEAQRLRTEVARRLLAADRALTTEAAGANGPAAAPVMLFVAILIGAAFWGYSILGQPGYSDLPIKERIELAEERRANRPHQATIEAELPAEAPLQAIDPAFLDLVEKLRIAVAGRPDDLQGHQLLAKNEATLGNFAAAYAAQSRVIEIKGDAVSKGDYLLRATLMIQAARGQISPEAEADLIAALQIDQNDETALFFMGILNRQVGRDDLAFRFWKKLVEVADPGSPWLPEVRARIGALAESAGVRYELPSETPALAGPTAEDVQNAANMTPQDREAMIRNMVEGLNDRLASSGGTAEEWARLITALGTLGEADRARAVWTEAQVTFAGREAELATLTQAAQDAGVAE